MIKVLFVLLSITIYSYGSIGYISAIRGEVFVERDGKSSLAFKGFKLENKDIIKTERDGKAQLLFEDNTVIRIGRSSTFEIEDYLYGKGNEPKAKFKVQNGFFSAVTGEIGKVAKQNFSLQTKTATIGIRGTHFQGTVSNENEDIACLKGEIFLSIGDRVIDVVAGEILNIKAGVPSAPRTLQSVDIDGMEDKASLENEISEINNQLSAISNIKDSDVKYAQYQQLMVKIASIEDAIVSKNYTKSPTIIESENGDVKLGVYTKNDAIFNENDPLEEKLSAIKDALPYDIFFETSGKTEIDVPTLSSWNGDIENGKILKYSGNIILVGNLDPDSPNTVLTENGVQKIDITIDTLNKVVNGNFNYLDETIRFSDAGTGAVTSTNILYFANNILETGDGQIITNQVENGFTENSIYSRGAFVDSNYWNLSDKEKDKTQLISGGFVASKVSEYDLYKKEISSDEVFSWGYWAYNEDGEEKLRGGWIKPNLDLTSAEKIAEFKNSEVVASYSGDIFGTVENYLEGTSPREMSGNVDMTFDFMSNKVDGKLEFQSDVDSYSIEFEAVGDDSYSVIKENGFSFNKTTSTSISGNFIDKGSDIPEYMYGSGNFYGENGEKIAGGFTTGFENGDVAIGVIKADKISE